MKRGAVDALERWTAAMVRWRWAVLALAVVLCALALEAALTGLRIDTDTTEMISNETPARRNMVAFHTAFSDTRRVLLLVLDGESEEEVEAAAEALAKALGEEPTFRTVWNPSGDAFFARNGLLYLDTESLAALADRLAASAPLLSALAADPSLPGLFGVLRLALSNLDAAGDRQDSLARLVGAMAEVAEATAAGRPARLSWRRLLQLGESQSRRLLVTQPRLDYASLSPAAAAVATVRRQAAALGIDGERVRLRPTGSVALDYDELKSAEASGKTAAGLSLVAVLVLLGFAYRSARLTVATLLTLGAGLILTAGFATLAVGQLNLISVAFAVLFVGLGVDFSIHFCLRCREEAAAGGGTGAIARAAGGCGRGLAIAAAGAGIGFYAFLPTDYRGFAELGLISGTSMFIAFAATYTVLPALLSILGGTGPARLPRYDPWGAVDRLVARHRRAVLLIAGLAFVGGLALLPWVRFDFDPLNLKDPASESFTTYRDLARDPKNAVHAAEVLAPDAEAAERTAADLARLPEVASTRTLASYLPKEQEAKLAIVQDMAFFLAPALQPKPAPAASDEDRLAATAALLQVLDRAPGDEAARLKGALSSLADDSAGLARLEDNLLAHLPALLGRLRLALEAGPVGLDDLPAKLRRQWLSADGQYRVQVLPKPELAGTRRFADAVLAAAPNATGGPIMVSEGGRTVVGAFEQATAYAVAAIALMLLVLYRRPALLIPALGPLALAAILTLATSALIGPPLNFANIIVLPLLFGLGMASAVHLVERRHQLAAGTELMATTTPRAVLFSTLTTLASFGSLAASAHRGMASMGLLLTVAIVYMLLATLVVLPALMPLVARWTGDRL